jgi:hypothetical protein
VLAPDNVQVPVPALETVPAPVPIILASELPVAVPFKVNANPEPVIVEALLKIILFAE